MNIDSRNTHYQSTVGEVPVGTVVIPSSGRWTGETCLVAFDEDAEEPRLVHLATGHVFDSILNLPCTAYPGSTVVVAGGRG